MPILPIDTGRYGTPEMRKIFEEETRIQKMLDVEAALVWAHAEVGNIPREDAEKIMAVASLKHVKLSRIKEIEREIKHDIAALVRALARSQWTERGLCSSRCDKLRHCRYGDSPSTERCFGVD